jgi:CPA1 family monovalent cation:H+ antiporter
MNDPAGAVAVPLMLVVAALSVIARRFGVPSPMLMLVAGTAIAFVPGMPALSLGPTVVLLWLLPPLLYSSGVGMSWRGFRSSLHPIMLLAIGLVLATPYIAFWPAHAAGGSGVIACVASGLYVSWNGRKLIRPDTRLQGYFIWDMVVWATEAVIFFLAGLQARQVFAALADGTWTRAVVAGVLVTLVVVIVRFAWVFPASYLPSKLLPRRAHADAAPDWRFAFMLAFCGLRGAVSLVAALLVPATIDGQPFPDRNVVLFATYCVVVFTLVGLGSALPAVARTLGIDRVGADEAARNAHEEQEARLQGIEAARRFVDEMHDAPTAEARALLADELSQRRAMAMHRREGECGMAEMQDVAMRLSMIAAERAAITDAYEANHLTDEARRRIERELDLEEARLRQSVLR